MKKFLNSKIWHQKYQILKKLIRRLKHSRRIGRLKVDGTQPKLQYTQKNKVRFVINGQNANDKKKLRT